MTNQKKCRCKNSIDGSQKIKENSLFSSKIGLRARSFNSLLL